MTTLTDTLRRRVVQRHTESPLHELHPHLQHREPLFRQTSDVVTATTGAAYRLDAKNYNIHPWVKRAIALMADNFSPLPLRVVRGTGQEAEPVPGHEIQAWLDAPNPSLPYAEVWRQWIIDMMLGGEEGHEINWSASNRFILELWPRQPDHFLVRPGADGARYNSIAGYTIDDNILEPYKLEPREFVHYKFYNPLNFWRGIGPITAVRNSILIDQFAQAWSEYFFRNNARPDYAIIAPEGVTTTERNDLEIKLAQKFRGPVRAHKPIILEDGITDIKTFSFPPIDMAWLDQRKFSRDEVAAIFGVPDELMGYGRDTYENFGTALIVFWSLTLVPLVQHRDNTLTAFLRRSDVGLLRPDERVQTDTSQVSALQEDISGKLDHFERLWRMGYPANALNQHFGLGLPEPEGGNIGYLPINLIPISSSGALSITESNNGNGRQAARVISRAVPEYGSERHQQLLAIKTLRIQPYVRRMKPLLRAEIQRQESDVIAAVRQFQSDATRTLPIGDMAYVKRAEIEFLTKQIQADDVFDRLDEADRFEDAFRALLQALFNAIGAFEFGALDLDDVDFDGGDPFVQAALQNVLRAFAQRTNDTTYNGLVELFQAAEAAGESTNEIIERLGVFFGDRRNPASLERIARTTMTSAAGSADVEAWRQTGVVQQKTWVSALQTRTRETHADAHGQTVGLDEAYIVGGEFLQFPGDPAGSAGNIINCLCTHVAEVAQ